MDAYLEWSIKLSLLMYASTAPGGSIRAEGVTSVDGQFRFPLAPSLGGTDEYASTGSVTLFAHYGMPLTTFSSLRVHRSADEGWLLSNSPTEGNPVDAFRLGAPSGTGAALVFDDVTLTETGAEMFAGYYKAGEIFDPIDIQFPC
ncbi:hypothetical protein ET475_05720 [Microbacterium protaetiae]|uniref:Htaa domain-containing protein n=1 Tax=Microbacterium protaetiae TaxID=2509458 RepID=A0A4V0YD55_9MICO|nr:HtaA domain-containing protein [Microbacterium protaetiae]QAY59531.1 hypothetical protein ET475_05720 [Microbacterium protaetiae]